MITFTARKQLIRMIQAVIVSLFATSPLVFAQGGRFISDDAWSFGITADSQWTITHNLTWESDDPYYAHVNPNYREENPNYVSVSTALKLNEAFISHGVSFVVQLGDLTDRAGNDAIYTHAEARQPLYDAGIGFFPVRGNHETYGYLYGLDPDADVNIPAWRDAFPQTQGEGPNLVEARNFNIPENPLLRGLSYSFDYGKPGSDTRFVFVDIEATYSRLVDPEPHEIYGLGLQYRSWIVYQHDQVVYQEDETEIQPGAWFRIDSADKPSTSFPGSEEELPIEDYVQPQQPDRTTSGTGFNPGEQQGWIDQRLQDSQRPEHAFVLTHRNLMGQAHIDTAWGSNPAQRPEAQNIFYKSLEDNGVRYFLSAHDHMHTRSIVTSPDGTALVEQLIASSGDPKFYKPIAGTMADQRSREAPISQELNNIGFYIFTVDGNRVSAEYFSDEVGNFGTDYCWPDGFAGPDGTCRSPLSDNPPERMGSLVVPEFNFVKRENWGYGLNGQRFVVPQGISYAGQTAIIEDEFIEFLRVRDEFNGTRAQILSGSNGSESTDNIPDASRPLTKVVTTGWLENPDTSQLLSDVLSLWGMSELGVEQTDVYVLSMSFSTSQIRLARSGAVGIATYVNGQWVSAVDENFEGESNFVVGPYVEGSYGLGTYGVDPDSMTAWAVLNYNADFAVSSDL